MSTAAQQRLRRGFADGQLALGIDLPADSQPTPRLPAGEDEAQDRFRVLADAVKAALLPEDDPWAGSSYEWVKTLPSASRGKAGVALLERWLRATGHPVDRRRIGQVFDLTLGDRRVMVKLSTEWSSGEYTFQGIRDGDFDTYALLGVAPERIHLWLLPRAAALANRDRASGDNGWITVTSRRPADWLAEYGGTLTTVADLIQADGSGA